MASKKVIAGSDGVTAKQLKELMNQIDLNTLSGSAIQNVLDHPKLLTIKPLNLQGRLLQILELFKEDDKKGTLDFVLPIEQFKTWKDIIMYSVCCTRLWHNDLDDRKHKAFKEYFKSSWEEIDNAKNDDELNKAVGKLAVTIYYQ